MAKGDPLNDEVKLLIAEIYQLNPNLSAKQVRARVNAHLGGTWPGYTAVQQVVKAVKAEMKKNDPEDKLWKVTPLSTQPYSIPPQVIKVKKLIEETEMKPSHPLKILLDLRSQIKGQPLFSIRDAKWVALFSSLVPDPIPGIGELALVALLSSFFEKLYKLAGIEFDSAVIEKMLMINPLQEEDIKSFNSLEDTNVEELNLFARESREIINELKKKGVTQVERPHKKEV